MEVEGVSWDGVRLPVTFFVFEYYVGYGWLKKKRVSGMTYAMLGGRVGVNLGGLMYRLGSLVSFVYVPTSLVVFFQDKNMVRIYKGM
jgi:hypothetical protein